MDIYAQTTLHTICAFMTMILLAPLCNVKNHPFLCEKTNRIFDQVFIMCVMYSDHEEWTNYIVPELSALFEEYSDVIQLQNIGFPENWKDILKY